MQNIIIICAMVVFQVSAGTTSESDDLWPSMLPAALQRLTQVHVELSGLQGVLQFCAQRSDLLKGKHRKDVDDFMTFSIESKQKEARLFVVLIDVPFVKQSWVGAEAQCQPESALRDQIDCNNAEDVLLNFQKRFRDFDFLAKEQCQLINALQLILAKKDAQVDTMLCRVHAEHNKLNVVEDTRKILESKRVLQGVKQWIIGVMHDLQSHVEGRNSEMRIYANKFGVDLY
ncbi:MAG: hypothetical protein OXC30_03040 [Alphaproteobacteria bacterium]|nr:hypothetical protein [Alphaproteobacteria bacterium]